MNLFKICLKPDKLYWLRQWRRMIMKKYKQRLEDRRWIVRGCFGLARHE
jgi:hypothetical protein